MSKKAAEHHKKAAERLTHAARHRGKRGGTPMQPSLTMPQPPPAMPSRSLLDEAVSDRARMPFTGEPCGR